MIALKPGRATLADWRAVADGAGVRLDPAALPAVEASARTVDAIVAAASRSTASIPASANLRAYISGRTI